MALNLALPMLSTDTYACIVHPSVATTAALATIGCNEKQAGRDQLLRAARRLFRSCAILHHLYDILSMPSSPGRTTGSGGAQVLRGPAGSAWPSQSLFNDGSFTTI